MTIPHYIDSKSDYGTTRTRRNHQSRKGDLQIIPEGTKPASNSGTLYGTGRDLQV